MCVQRHCFFRANCRVKHTNDVILKQKNMMLWRCAQSIKLFRPCVRI